MSRNGTNYTHRDPGGNNGDRPRGHDYWAVYLAAAIGGALVTRPFEMSRVALRMALQEFTKSRSCSAELREIIRSMKGEK